MACLETANEEDLTPVLDIDEVIISQQATFKSLYELARNQAQPSKTENNPQLFAVVEEVLKPLFLVWRKKYIQIQELMKKESRRSLQGEAYFYQVAINPSGQLPSLQYCEYYATEAEFLVHELGIRINGKSIHSYPELINDRQDLGYQEKFSFQTSSLERGYVRQISFLIEEDKHNKNYRYNHQSTKDRLWIESKECFFPPRRHFCVPVYPQVGSFVTWSLQRDSVIEPPVAKRLY